MDAKYFKFSIGGSGYSTQYDAVYNAMTNKPDATNAGYQDTLVTALVDGGYWARMDAFWCFAQENNDDSEALINWINPGTTDADNPTGTSWTTLEGYTGNGTDDYISTNWISDTHGSNYVLDSATFGIYVRNNLQSDEELVNAGSGHIRFQPRRTNDTKSGRVKILGKPNCFIRLYD